MEDQRIPHLKKFLKNQLMTRSAEQGRQWLSQQEQKIAGEQPEQKLYMAFSSASRFFEKQRLALSAQEQDEASQLRKGWQPGQWNVLQTVRAWLVLLLPSENADRWLTTLNRIFDTADMNEQVALYSALPVLPHQQQLVSRCREGLRTNITAVFDAIALDNPYPADFLPEEGWNQMVLKAVFMQRPLYRIYGADERVNVELAQMLLDFAHERRSAGRQVMPELWRFVGPFLTDSTFSDIEIAVREGDDLQREAALLACSGSGLPAARQLREKYHQSVDESISKEEQWRRIGGRFEKSLT